jgi:hypothetical protein
MMKSESYAFWAVIEHFQGMLGNDGHYLAQIRESGGRLSTDLAVTIAKDYSVARTIHKYVKAENEPVLGISSLVFDIEELASNWPTDLFDRAKACCKIAEHHSERQTGKKKSTPYSGVTKIMWFLRPHGWTMFDSLAQFGLTGPGAGSKCVEAFYQALEKENFFETCAEVQDILDKQGLKWLYAERVVDKFLMFRGSQWKDSEPTYFRRARTRGERFLDVLDHHLQASDARKRLECAAAQIGEIFPNSRFDTCWVKAR